MSKGTYVHKAVDGVVISIEDRHFPNGKYLVTARVRDDQDRVWVCTLWNELANAFMLKGLLNQRAYMEGGIKEENVVGVKFFDGKNNATASKPVEPAKELTPQEERTEIKDEGGDMLKVIFIDYRGLRTYQYKHKKYFVRVDGKWEDKMGYCLRIMGGETAMSYLREFKDNGKPGGINVSKKAFDEKLELMLKTCQDYTGDFLEYWEPQKEEPCEKTY